MYCGVLDFFGYILLICSKKNSKNQVDAKNIQSYFAFHVSFTQCILFI